MKMTYTNSDDPFVQHEPCFKCGSKDALARYESGSAFCFSCSHSERSSSAVIKVTKEKVKVSSEFIEGTYKAIESRKLTEASCRLWEYQAGEARRVVSINPLTYGPLEKCLVSNYYNLDKELVAQKLRFKGKEFGAKGKLSDYLFGMHLAQPGKYIVVTEGEEDAIAYSQAVAHKYAAVSVPNGAQGAKKALTKHLQWLESNYEHVVLMFDQDKVGKEATVECAALFSPGKCLVAKLSEKDACDMLKSGKQDELIRAVFRAKPYRPESIIAGDELWDSLVAEETTADAIYPYDCLNTATMGLRKGELVTICAGSGIGKSQVCREIAYGLTKQGKAIAYIGLEESVRKSALSFLSIELNVPLHLNPHAVSEEVLRKAYDDTVGNGSVYFYDHFGSLDSKLLLENIRYTVKAYNVEYVILDHISIVVSGSGEGEERRNIDNTMTALRSLVQELNIGMILVSHLKRLQGDRGHENGANTGLAQLRGSGSIGQLSDIVIGLERDQQHITNANLTKVRVLKNRFTGENGVVGTLEYFKDTGRLKEVKVFEEVSDEY